MIEPKLFEEMLAAYPAEKRELARQVYHRFADGDSSNFFTQLFLVLDVYAHYSERIPTEVIEANQNAVQAIQYMREEIALLANTIEGRDVSISNHAEKTDELCKITIAKCNETVSCIELMLKNLGSQVDTKGIVQRLESIIQASINREVLEPFLKRTEELSKQVVPSLQKVQEASAEASRCWGRQIWKTALISGAILGLSIAALGISFSYWKIKRHYDTALSEQIISEANTLKQNQKAFTALGVLNAPIHVARSTDSQGHFLPNTYCIYVEGAQEADMSGNLGRIFFGSSRDRKSVV